MSAVNFVATQPGVWLLLFYKLKSVGEIQGRKEMVTKSTTGCVAS